MRTTSRIIVFLFLLLGHVSCLANSHFVVVSTNKNGGHETVYTLDTTTAAPRSSTPLPPPPPPPSWRSQFRAVFLPTGPTPSGYLSFATLNALQDLSTQLRGVLATQRILEGLGVGRADATATSAILNFLVRDGCGMFATLLFTATAASKFAADVKRWRLLADIMVDVGITLEILAAQVPPRFFLLLLSLGNMCKAVCGVAAGACGGTINLHWASCGSDIADIQAKFGAQHAVTASVGLMVAALTTQSLAHVPMRQLWSGYWILTVLHIWINRKCMRMMAFTSLNTVRLRLLLKHYRNESHQSLPTPQQMAQTEPLLFLPTRHTVPPIEYGISFHHVAHKMGHEEEALRQILEQATQSYWIFVAQPHCIMVVLQKGISPTDQAKAYFHATLLAQSLKDEKKDLEDREVEVQWNKFANQCVQAGWDLTKTELQTHGYHIEIQAARQ
ncbi:hypothetical protein FisN_2Lh140 [Fistulifera solaris]|uniref:Uncharacterized protein n=1 Tax=Fistulifera solaris TaxID=1519565 RepID=A0A1Z5JWR3_FISSO|nr:hypothetical protein FisN_2Lh140 [Fistulifera solaris]|eukprot:GAX18483.1 hypothetical protein FisN_2Lh140 [Fistulifera solaris]